ncbi:MAG: DUF3467 domain-containing protein [Pirellulales bacterium]
MSETNQPPDEGESQDPKKYQQVQTNYVTARVPEGRGEGVFSTGTILMTGPTEFIIDFIQNIGPPAKVVARVVLPHAVMPQVINALRQNVELYSQKFGAPPELPKPQQQEGQKRPSVQEIYDELKLPDDLLPGSYANGLMIAHTASEFKLDFLTNLFPHSAVSARVYVSAPQLPRMVESLTGSFEQFQQQQRARAEQQGQQPGGSQNPPSGMEPPEPPKPDEPSAQ